MYKPYTEGMRKKIRGRGFTLFGLLDDIPELATERFFIWEKNILDFDVYIIADIWRQWDDYERLCRLVDRKRIVVIDPADKPRIFPWNNLAKEHRYFRRNLGFLRQLPHFYYKREMIGTREALAALPAISDIFSRYLLPEQIRPLSFSIPSEKIINNYTVERLQLFARNIVDAEVSEKIAGSFYTPLGEQHYAFDTEVAYYADIQKSKFGITTKRSGWDCMRHYEIAANGAVICFRNLDQKPVGSAPHGLNQTNCIIYKDYTDLMLQVDSLNSNAYLVLQQNSRQWIGNYTTSAVAQRLLDDLKF
ncbi:hypothetical protein BH10BAC3_BH10BAC3_33880 [soil metagenome]